GRTRKDLPIEGSCRFLGCMERSIPTPSRRSHSIPRWVTQCPGTWTSPRSGRGGVYPLLPQIIPLPWRERVWVRGPPLLLPVRKMNLSPYYLSYFFGFFSLRCPFLLS